MSDKVDYVNLLSLIESELTLTYRSILIRFIKLKWWYKYPDLNSQSVTNTL